MPAASSGFESLELTCAETLERHRRAEIELVDVREPYERAAGHIEGSVHIELGRLAAEAARIDPERPVVFFCRVGARSGMAARAFRRAGFPAQSMAGGLVAWDAAGLPLAPEGGVVADH